MVASVLLVSVDELGSGQESKFARGLARIEQQADVCGRDARRFTQIHLP